MLESRFFHFLPEGKYISFTTQAEALEALKRGGFVWLDFHNPVKEDLTALMEPLGLHELSIEDCFDENQIPKIEDYPQNTFVLFNAFRYSNRVLTIHEVDFFIGRNYLVTVTGHGPDERPFMPGIERIVENEIEDARQGPAFLAHILLDWIVDQKFHSIEAFEDELDEAEDAILADHAHFDPSGLVHLRRELLGLRKSLFHEREILVKICRKDSLFIPEKAIYFYRDIYDHLSKFFELTESYRDLVTSLMEMYLSIINNQMTRAANQTNITVRRLTFITTIFMPLSLLAGVGGMSEWSMMTGPENWRIAYPAFLAGVALIGVASYLILKRLGREE